MVPLLEPPEEEEEPPEDVPPDDDDPLPGSNRGVLSECPLHAATRATAPASARIFVEGARKAVRMRGSKVRRIAT
jgi:hypothetical protein